ncbi:MAG: hypothetical protein Q8P77_01385 [Candidatus Veblenbacteria bacterium]|nr:hypothetical protein [Candidatus Veblenbacteria bacterium]
MYTKQSAATAAEIAAKYLKNYFKIEEVSTAIVLGTGLNNTIVFDTPPKKEPVPFHWLPLPEVSNLPGLDGHARTIQLGYVDGEPILVLNGRFHMNETIMNPELIKMVRLQIEMLPYMGVKKLILTCAAGSIGIRGGLHPEVGDVVLIDGFITLYAPKRPLFGGEFNSAEDALSPDLIKIAQTSYPTRRWWKNGTYAMVCGPDLEGRKRDKDILHRDGACCVGMSILTEAAVAAQYPPMEVLALAFISNDWLEKDSHQLNKNRMEQHKEDNIKLLTGVASAVAHCEETVGAQ